MVAIDVADREPSHDPSGLQYELLGEACIPGIDTSDWQSTFEEQAVVRRVVLSSSGLQKNIFSEEDKLFCFGSHMVAQEVTERFKLTNPFKVECTVNLSVKPRALKGGGGSGKAGEETPLAIEIEPSKILLPPHEHRYISAIFTPPAMQTFHATFEAAVEQGVDPATKLLTFDVVGEGTLPHVLVAQPAARTDDGLPVIAFPKLLVGRSKTLPLQLVNEGILPASVRLALSGAPAFSCSLVGQAITIDPKSSQTIDVKFEPRPIDAKEAEDGGAAPPVEAKISLTVAHNAFEDNTIVLNGSAYAQDVAFEEMPGEGDGDAAPTSGCRSATSRWASPSRSPSRCGTTRRRRAASSGRRRRHHLRAVGRPPAAARRQVDHRHLPLDRARVHGGAAAGAEEGAEPSPPADAKVSMVEIKYAAGAQADWDDTMTVVTWLSEEEYLEREAKLEAERAAKEEAAKKAAEEAAAAKAAEEERRPPPRAARRGRRRRQRRRRRPRRRPRRPPRRPPPSRSRP